MQAKSKKHILGWRTRKAEAVAGYIPAQPFELPHDAGPAPQPPRGSLAHGSLVLFTMKGLDWFHSVAELTEWIGRTTNMRVTGPTIRYWLKLAVMMRVIEVRVQPLTHKERLIFMKEGQMLDDKYTPYLTIEECNERFLDKNGEGHTERLWWG